VTSTLPFWSYFDRIRRLKGAPNGSGADAKNQLARQTTWAEKWFKEQLKHWRRSSSVQIDSAAKRIEQRTAARRCTPVGGAEWVEGQHLSQFEAAGRVQEKQRKSAQKHLIWAATRAP
jgi:hypothetical protein